MAEQIRLGLVGYGEIGNTLGRGLHAAGLASIVAYDRYAFDGPYSGLIQRRAREAGVKLVPDHPALAAQADLILGVTPGSASLDSAASLSEVLTPQHWFIDVASATPGIKRAVAARVQPTGVIAADASIVGTPADGHALQILASGPAASKMRDALIPWGMRIEMVGPEIGTASGIKILRSVVMKGLEALVVECLLASRQLGIEEPILQSLDKTFAKPFRDLANGLITTSAIHAERRAEEVAMSADALAEIGLHHTVAATAATRLQWVATLGLKQHFQGAVPARYETVLDAMVAKGALS
jgi:3-hydroxyisobutyrate dehydrogenase-like beta-hydroxyacid dehydrogenase